METNTTYEVFPLQEVTFKIAQPKTIFIQIDQEKEGWKNCVGYDAFIMRSQKQLTNYRFVSDLWVYAFRSVLLQDHILASDKSQDRREFFISTFMGTYNE